MIVLNDAEAKIAYDALGAWSSDDNDAPHEEIRRIRDRIASSPRGLRPMAEAPRTGPPTEILVATTDRAGCNGWLIVHHAEGGGEEQPPFRGWFFWTGHEFQQIDARSLLGWIPLPEARR